MSMRSTGLTLGFALTAALAVAALREMPLQAAQGSPAAGDCRIVQNFYFPQEGKEQEALATRIKANQVRAKLGLPTGRILWARDRASRNPATREVGPGKTSYLTSVTEFASQADLDRTNKALGDSQEFKTVFGHMASLLTHFETVTWTPAWGECTPETP